jgi:hypothetical protein
VLYEDLRIEIAELRTIQLEYERTGAPLPDYRVIYFLRRALTTIFEFGRALTIVRRCPEFKRSEARLATIDSSYITTADRYLQEHWRQIKDFRNEFGAHIQAKGVQFATSNLAGSLGSITWNSASDGLPMGLECDFAGQIVVGTIASKLPGSTDVHAELQKALAVIIDGFVHAQAAMCALAHAFLWDRFGR